MRARVYPSDWLESLRPCECKFGRDLFRAICCSSFFIEFLLDVRSKRRVRLGDMNSNQGSSTQKLFRRRNVDDDRTALTIHNRSHAGHSCTPRRMDDNHNGMRDVGWESRRFLDKCWKLVNYDLVPHALAIAGDTVWRVHTSGQ